MKKNFRAQVLSVEHLIFDLRFGRVIVEKSEEKIVRITKHELCLNLTLLFCKNYGAAAKQKIFLATVLLTEPFLSY